MLVKKYMAFYLWIYDKLWIFNSSLLFINKMAMNCKVFLVLVHLVLGVVMFNLSIVFAKWWFRKYMSDMSSVSTKYLESLVS